MNAQHIFVWQFTWAMACTPPEPTEPDVRDENPNVGQGPALRCPMEFADSPDAIGLTAMPITADDARAIAEAAEWAEAVDWLLYPESSAPTANATWTVRFLDEAPQVSQKLARSISETEQTLLSQPSCEAGAAWFVPVEVTLELDNGLVFSAPTGIRVFGTGEHPDDVRIAAFVTPPMELSETLQREATQDRGYTSSAVVEGDVSGATYGPDVSVVAYSEHVSSTLWRSDTEASLPCGGDFPCEGVEE